MYECELKKIFYILEDFFLQRLKIFNLNSMHLI